MSTTLHNPDSELAGSGGMLVALIGPNDAHRKIVAKALASSEARTVREFIDSPARLSDLPAMMRQNYDVVMIDVDSDESYALEIVKSIAATSNALVMVYSKRNDPELLTSCMRAGARDFLPLPADGNEEAGESSAAVQEVAKADEPANALSSDKQDATSGAEETYFAEEERAPAKPYEFEKLAIPAAPGAPELRLVKGAADENKDEDQAPLRFTSAPQPSAPATDFDEWDSVWIRGVQPASTPGAGSKPAGGPLPLAKRVNDWDAAHLSAAAQPASAKSPESSPQPAIPLEIHAKSKDDGEAAWPGKVPVGVKSPEPSPRTAIPVEFLAKDKEEDDAVPLNSALPATVTAPGGSLFGSIAPDPQAKSGSWLDSMPQSSARQSTRTLRDGTEIPLFQYEVPEEEKQGQNHVAHWVMLAGGLGVLVCLLALGLFYLHPWQGSAVASQAKTAVSQPQPQPETEAPADWHPVAAADQPAASRAKPSPSTPAADSAGSDPPAGARQVSSAMMDAQLNAPARLSRVNAPASVEEPPAGFTPGAIDSGGVSGAVFGGQSTAKVVRGGYAISAGVAQGMLIHKSDPIYPQFARLNRTAGTVVLGATIAKTGSIQNLHVISGPKALCDAALDAVKSWRYRPYMLNNEPVEVQTTINVVFSLGQ